MDDYLYILISLSITALACGVLFLSKRAKSLTKHREEISIQANSVSIEPLNNTVDSNQNHQASDWLTNFFINHPFVCDFLAQPWLIDTCKFGIFLGTLSIFYQIINLLPNQQITSQSDASNNSATVKTTKNNSIKRYSTGIVHVTPDKCYFILTKQQKKNLVFMEIYKHMLKQNKQQDLIAIFTNPNTKFNVLRQIKEMARVSGINQVKINNGTCLVFVPSP